MTTQSTLIDDDLKEGIRRSVSQMIERLDLRARVATYADLVHTGSSGGPTLFLEDISAIPFVDGVPGIEAYQHRARVRADDGDIFVTVTPPTPGYEAYCGSLGLGTPRCLMAAPGENLLAVASACERGEVFEELRSMAAEAGGLTIHPYMAIDAVWSLARTLADAAKVPVKVIGPPPDVLWVANDKNLLSETVQATLSEHWLVETFMASSPPEMARHLEHLAQKHEEVGLKRTRCASAMGNVVFDSQDLIRGGRQSVLEKVTAFLDKTQWPAGEDVQLVAWKDTNLSPSTQLWIPPDGHGSPRVEGIFEQLLEGKERVFQGSRPSTLPSAVNERLSYASVVVAEAFQAMGYAGRCSFDFIVVGEVEKEPEIHFTECNGRWGGTSTPMHLVDRLFPARRPDYIAKDYIEEALVGLEFEELLRRVGPQLYDPKTDSGRFIFYNVGPLAKKGKFDVISVGTDPQDAAFGIKTLLPELLGIH